MADDAMVVAHDATLEPLTTGTGRLDSMVREQLRGIRYLADQAHEVCFLEDVVDLVRGSSTLLQVDLKLMRPMTATRAAALAAALRPLGDHFVIGSQAHWNLRHFSGLPVAFDPTLQWHYAPGRALERTPRTRGAHGLWDDSPLAGNALASSEEYIEARIRDLRGLLPQAVEWMVDIQTALYLTSLAGPLGGRLREFGCSLALWTLHDEGPALPAIVDRKSVV